MCDYIKESAKKIPIVAQVDVLVLGSGPAGVCAAISAGRQGAKTILIEQGGDLGGISTSGMMSHWTGNTEGGIYEEILQKSADIDDDSDDLGFNGSKRQLINTERLKTVYLQMCMEANVHIKLYTFAAEVIMDGHTVKGVILESKSGREAITAKVVIDCTGDGDIAKKAGAEYILGREGDGAMQPATIMFKIAGVDYETAIFPGGFEDYIKIPEGEVQSLGKMNLPFPAGHVLLYRTTLPGVVTCNMTNCVGIDGTKADDLTKATIICRKQINEIVQFLQRYVPGYKSCFVISSASLIGIRETRHFKGIKTITEEDIEQARVFDDWIATKARFNFDVHNMTGSGLDRTGEQKSFKQTEGYTIPYGCLVPEKIDGLLLAGRNISGTHKASSNYRVMPICANMGQGAGIAAAISAKENIKLRDVVPSKIQEKLKLEGVEV